MMFFKRRRDRRAFWLISGQGGRPDGSRPTPKQLMGTSETHVVRRKSLHDRRVTEQRIHALEVRIRELEADVAEGLDAVLCVASYALGACRGTGSSWNFGAVEAHDKAERIAEIVRRLRAMHP
ncbi:hypothetical protein [Asaia bogorensis]|uniref:hypothetical protein n=1 Tax=Asaia bogorensis TaxID=91915 RepID=UPI000EFA7845|nr:hypothetical protein [Asaia bogorensis]